MNENVFEIKLVEIGDVEHEDIADNRIAVFDKVGTVMDDQSVCELSSASKPTKRSQLWTHRSFTIPSNFIFFFY